ncbi:MAG: recombinase family protein [Actinobacteria bacterium]|nr:recombinase family protein [Actinomycetota bacterium]
MNTWSRGWARARGDLREAEPRPRALSAPRRNPKDENALPQTWSRSRLQFMLRNSKYTGYVWNRHDKRKGRPLLRPRDHWV